MQGRELFDLRKWEHLENIYLGLPKKSQGKKQASIGIEIKNRGEKTAKTKRSEMSCPLEAGDVRELPTEKTGLELHLQNSGVRGGCSALRKERAQV